MSVFGISMSSFRVLEMIVTPTLASHVLLVPLPCLVIKLFSEITTEKKREGGEGGGGWGGGIILIILSSTLLFSIPSLSSSAII